MSIEDPISVRWVDTVDAAPEALWERCFGPPLEGRWWYAAMERGGAPGQFTFAYGVLERGGEAVGIAPTFLMDVPIDLVAPPLVAMVLRGVGAVVKRARYQRTMFVGSPCSDEGTVGLVPGVLLGDVAAAVQSAVERRAAEAGAALTAWKDFAPHDAEALEALSASRGMFRVVSFPGTRAALPAGGFEAYLKSLKSDHRHHLKKQLKRGEKAGALAESILQHPDPATLNEIFGLFRQTYEKGKTKFEELTPEFFRRIAEAEASYFILLRNPATGKLAAFMLCFRLGARVINKFIGLDYALGPEWFLYFRLWKSAVDWASKAGANDFQSGQTGYRAKLGLGCGLVPLTNYCRHRNPILHRVFAKVGGGTTPADLDEELAVYLKAHPEAMGGEKGRPEPAQR